MDQGVRARVDGKTKTAARTAWSLEIGPLRARCLREDDGSYVVQGRTEKGWSTEIGKGTDPLVLLKTVANSKGVARILGQ
jgi:hypothetical protein